ncbi:MAG: class I SAM-dependent methyltransferase [Saprospiraceae bacterium]
MNWKHFWNQRARLDNPLIQVARIRHGLVMDEQIMERIAERIKIQLNLTPLDDVLDVCCGNGYLSRLLTRYAKSVTGVDLAEDQINRARRFSENSKLIFYTADAASFNLERKFDKILLYFSFQYFDSYQTGKDVITNLIRHLKPGGVILLGDIPDQEKIHLYYTTPWLRLKNKIKTAFGKSDMGKFWNREELDQICHSLNVSGRYVTQEDWQPYADYRFDYLIVLQNEN